MPETRAHISSQSVWVVLMDMACLVAGGALGVALRLGQGEIGAYVYDHVDGWLVFVGSVILANYLAGSYRLQRVFSRFDIFVTWVFSLTFAILVLSITSYAWFRLLLGRGVLALSIGFYSAFSFLLRIWISRGIFRSGMFLCRTVVLGTGASAQEVRRTVESAFVVPAHKVVAYLDVAEAGKHGSRDGVKVLDGVAVLRTDRQTFEDVVLSLNVNLLVIAHAEQAKIMELYPQLRRLRFEGVELLTSLNVEELYNWRIPIETLTQESLMQASLESGMPLVRRFKRLLDVAFASVFCVAFSPLALLIGLAIKMSSPKERVLYSQERVGHFGRVFRIYKFRTMKEDAERATGPVWASRDDPRITPLGRALRRFRLDEIPQIVNVLKGDMSMVGPRPERPEICATLEKEIPFYAERENVMPGLTGWAQIRYPYGSTVEDSRRKLEYDLYYMKYLSLRLDFQIILSTLRIVIFGKERNV